MTVGRLRVLALGCGALAVAGVIGFGTAGAATDRGRAGTPGKAARTVAGAPAEAAGGRGAVGGAAAGAPAAPVAPAGPAGTVAPPPANAGFDYQIGEPYRPPSGVGVVSRDHAERPAAGLYNICYVNGFQTQTEAAGWWHRTHDDLLLRRNGKLVVDGDWNEILLDTSTAAKRTALAGIVGGWIDECAAKGFRAVEVDNLDSWTRSQHMLTRGHAVAYATLLAARAHAKGLAIAQKNTVELGAAGRTQVGFDFAIAEDCENFDECEGYVDVYGDRVIVIEYDSAHFKRACGRYGAKLSIVRRDRDVTAPGSSTYVFQTC